MKYLSSLERGRVGVQGQRTHPAHCSRSDLPRTLRAAVAPLRSPTPEPLHSAAGPCWKEEVDEIHSFKCTPSAVGACHRSGFSGTGVTFTRDL